MEETLLGSIEWSLLLKLIIAFATGALIGTEREKARLEKKEEDTAVFPGVRSFGLMSILGALSICLVKFFPSEGLSLVVVGSMFIISILILAGFTLYRIYHAKEHGITTPIALALAYLLGVLVGIGLLLEAIAISIFVTFVLAIKLSVERALRGITYKELLSALQIGIMVFLLGPFVFIQELTDPVFHVISFRTLYIFFVVILCISYLSYMVLKLKRKGGLEIVSFFGGLVNSEATTVSFTRLCFKLSVENTLPIVAKGVVLANLAMVARNLFLLIIFYSILKVGVSNIWYFTFLGFLASLLTGYATIALVSRKESEIELEEALESPLSYRIAFKACVIFLVVLTATTLAVKHLGEIGVLAIGGLGGIASTTAVIFTILSLIESKSIDLSAGLAAILLSTATAILNKFIYLKALKAPKVLIKDLGWRLLFMSIPLFLTSILLVMGT